MPNTVKEAGPALFPHRLDRGELHLLVAGEIVTTFVAEHDH